MVKSFQFARLPKIYFRTGIADELASLAKSYGNRVILVTGRSSFINSPYAERLFHLFEKENLKFHLVTIPGEPDPAMVDDTVRKFRSENVNLVIAIGGGSVIDAGKAISAMMHRTESVVEFLEGVGKKEHPGTKLPFIAVPTTSGTGSEATKNAVISQIGKGGFKSSLRHDNFVPDIALVDPLLTMNCPREITLASGLDCFTQLIEAYLSDKAGRYTDALALEGLKAVRESLTRCFTNGDDVQARSGMSFAALTSGICLANAGLGAIHGFASSLGGMFDIPHGIICGSLMAKTNEVNVRELRKSSDDTGSLAKYAVLGKLFLGEKGRSDDFYIDGFVNYLHAITSEFKMPGLLQFGVRNKDIEPICAVTGNKNNPVKLSSDHFIEIITERLF